MKGNGNYLFIFSFILVLQQTFLAFAVIKVGHGIKEGRVVLCKYMVIYACEYDNKTLKITAHKSKKSIFSFSSILNPTWYITFIPAPILLYLIAVFDVSNIMQITKLPITGAHGTSLSLILAPFNYSGGELKHSCLIDYSNTIC